MKKAVQFGAGKIGLGFIGELLHDSGYEIVFADVMEDMVDKINKDKSYTLFLIDKDYEEKTIDNVSALNTLKPEDQEKAIDEIADADVITTSVMATNLPKIAPILAKGLKKRLENGNKEKAIVLACENAIMGTDILKNDLKNTGLITEEELDEVAVYPNTAVDRMVFGGTHHGKEGVEIGKNFELAIEKEKLVDPESEPIKGAEYVDDLEKYLKRKIYLINCGHALSAYLGKLKGKETVQDVLRDPELVKEVKDAVMESAQAINKEYGFAMDDLEKYVDGMLIERFTTPGVSDPVDRVAREPKRKLSPEDRIMGPANLAEKHGIDNTNLLKGVAWALKYNNPEDEQAVEIQETIKKDGVEKAITEYTGVEKGSRMYDVILDEYNKLS